MNKKFLVYALELQSKTLEARAVFKADLAAQVLLLANYLCIAVALDEPLSEVMIRRRGSSEIPQIAPEQSEWEWARNTMGDFNPDMPIAISVEKVKGYWGERDSTRIHVTQGETDRIFETSQTNGAESMASIIELCFRYCGFGC